ncbi:uncharacterized protein LOC143296460 [Babylonia areolata]|uniref:uncharacterized protein LOC143296460 n=1 Tax=Babylonia areolata TaxID=304850 RepID=UPI003FD692C5
MAEFQPCSQQHLICGICLEMYKNPRMLSCHHTFCEACIQAVVANSQGNFIECPQCRKRLRLTRNEVSKLQVNFYLTPLLEEARSPDRCDKHQKKLQFVCLDCDDAVCCDCILQDHRKHDLTDLGKAKEEIRAEMNKDMTEFDTVLIRLTSKLEQIRRFKQKAEDERSSVESALRERARQLHALIEGQLEKSLIFARNIANAADRSEDELQENVHLVEQLQEEARKVVDKNTGYEDLVTAHKKMHEHQQTTLNNIMHEAEKENCQYGVPAFYCDSTLSPAKTMVSLLGQVYVNTATMTITMSCAFQCCPANSSVHALCINGDGNIWTAYGDPRAQGKSWVAKFSPTGCMLGAPIAIWGRVCLADLSHGYVHMEGKYCKGKDIPTTDTLEASSHGVERKYNVCSPEQHDVYNKLRAKFLLRQHANHTCELWSVMTSECNESFVSNLLTHSPIAMDASHDGKFIAVLEEGQNHVCLYHRDLGYRPFSVFRGKLDRPIEPMDVCFYTIGDEERLVVADGSSKTLMILRVDQNCGCELVDQIDVFSSKASQKLKPTALCPDLKGQLWVGCQGGFILYVAPRPLDQSNFNVDK